MFLLGFIRKPFSFLYSPLFALICSKFQLFIYCYGNYRKEIKSNSIDKILREFQANARIRRFLTTTVRERRWFREILGKKIPCLKRLHFICISFSVSLDYTERHWRCYFICFFKLFAELAC